MAVAVDRKNVVTGAITAPKGFVAGAVHAGIRKSKLDLAVVRSTVPAVGAAMWTANRVQAAPVLVSKAHLAQAEPQAVVINFGCRERGDRGAGQAGRARDCCRGRLRSSGSSPSRCSSSPRA